jgi:hypothetical protein
MSTRLARSAGSWERFAAASAGLRESDTAAAITSRCIVALTDTGTQFRRTASPDKVSKPMLKIARRSRTRDWT